MSPGAATLERQDELERVVAALAAAADGEGRLIVIEGPAGIGKSRLVQHMREEAKERRFGRLHATGDELESSMAWAVVRQMVERSISRYRGEERRRLLAGPAGTALAALDGASDTGPATDVALARTLHALWWVAADLASFRPLLITVDDAQWADLPSLRFLTYLSRRIQDLPIALVVATRPPRERSGPLTELSAARGGIHVLLQPLSQDAVGALSASRGTDPAAKVVDALYAASGGNPLLTGQLLDELDARGLPADDPATAPVIAGLGPATISRSLLSRLPLDAVQLAATAAVLGRRSDPGLAGELARINAARLPDAIDALVVGHVLSAGSGELRFVHPVVREAVLAELGPGERTALHAAAAVELHARGAPLERVAAHLAAAPVGTLPGGAALLREAAAGLLAKGDAVTAAGHLRRALAETPADHALQAELGLALLRAGDHAPARDHLRAAARAAHDARAKAEQLAGAATATALLDGPSEAIAQLRATLDDWPEPGDDPSRLVLEARLATICFFVPDESQAAARRLRQFADLPGHTREERTLLALLAQRERYAVCPATGVAALAERALGAGAYLQDMADGADGMIAWVGAVMALIAADATDAAQAEIARAREWVRARGTPLEFGIASNAAAWLARRVGDVAVVEAEADACLAAVAPEDLSPHMMAVRATAVHVGVLAALDRGELTAAGEMLNAFDVQCADAPRMIPTTWLREGRTLLALACDQPQGAHEEALAFRDEVLATRLDAPWPSWRTAAVQTAQRVGEHDEARALAEEQLALAQRWGAASDVGTALRLCARVDAERRLDLLGDAVSVLESAPARLEHGRALVDLGEALRVARRRKAAHDPLRRGADIAAACGSTVLRQRALDGLAALGDRPRKQMFSGQESLTGSERRVAALAVEGRTNRDIAQELFVTPKTVENHLGRVYIKLGITSRRQLVGALH